MRRRLQSYFESYDPSLMAVCVVSREPLNSLEATVTSSLGSVPLRQAALRPRSVAPYPPEAPKLVEAVPVAEVRSLLLEWSLDFEDFESRQEPLAAV